MRKGGDDQGAWTTALIHRLAGEPDGEVIFRHVGAIDPDQVAQLSSLAESHSEARKDGLGLRKRLFNVLIESLDNLRLHTEPEFVQSGFARLTRSDQGYRLIVGNTLSAISAELLSSRVQALNEMDDADLREFHLKLLANNERTERGGAGLGLLTLARRSKRPIKVRSAYNRTGSVHFAMELNVCLA